MEQGMRQVEVMVTGPYQDAKPQLELYKLLA